MLTYELIPGGYQIFDNGRLWIDQPFNQDAYNETTGSFDPYTPEDAEAAALAFIASWETAEAVKHDESR